MKRYRLIIAPCEEPAIDCLPLPPKKWPAKRIAAQQRRAEALLALFLDGPIWVVFWGKLVPKELLMLSGNTRMPGCY